MRTVHLIWLGRTIPPRVDRIRAELAASDPDLVVRLWQDDDLTWLRNREWFLREPHLPSRADLARYEILLAHGGLYLDVDFRVHQPVTGVLEAAEAHGLVVARQSRATYCNGLLAATPGHPLLADLVAGVPAAYARTGRLTAPATTGPHYLTELLLAHLRTGGRAFELPQHAVFPWHIDEEPLPDAVLPDSVLVSHGWFRPDDAVLAAAEPARAVAPVVRRRDRIRRARGGPRARASARPAVHALIGRAEALRAGAPGPRARSVRHAPLRPTVAVLEGWSARLVRRRLTGSACFVDLHPASDLPLLAAGRAVDRPGRAIAVVADGADLGDAWRDPSIRGSMHVATADGDGVITAIRSEGSALVPTPLGAGTPPLGARIGPRGLDVAGLVGFLPRIDLVRFAAAHLTDDVGGTLRRMVAQGRIGGLVAVLDPWDPGPGSDLARDLLEQAEAAGFGVRLGPWLIEGRGRTWRQHLRVAARPFLVVLER